MALTAALIPAAALAAGLPKLALGESNHFSVRPHIIMLSADGGLYIAGSKLSSNKTGAISWSSWSSRRARGSGYVWANNCKPDCVSGKFFGQKVSISASNVSGGDFRTVTLSCTVGGKSKTDTLSLRKSGSIWYWNYRSLGCEKT